MIDRRRLMAVVAAALGLGGVTLALAQAGKPPLTVVSWGGAFTKSQMIAYVQPYRELRDRWVDVEDYAGGLDEIRQQVLEDDVSFGLDGSASILHGATGLNLTVSSGFEQSDDGGNPGSLYVKGGWITNLFDFGSSHFGIDLNRSTNNPTPSDRAWSVGGAFVQNLADFGTQLYAQLRWYDLDRDNDPDVDPITALTVGSRVKF